MKPFLFMKVRRDCLTMGDWQVKGRGWEERRNGSEIGEVKGRRMEGRWHREKDGQGDGGKEEKGRIRR